MAGSYFFDAVAGETPEDVKRKRAIVEALMGQAGPARNVGEGINSLFSGIAAGIMRNRADKSEAAGREKGDSAFQGLFAGFPKAPAPPASAGGSAGADYPSQRVAQAFGDDGNAYGEAIASIESGGNYGAIGPTHPKMGRALGKYQIMEANIGPWSKEALGREVSADEFLANPQIQDAIFKPKFQGYVAKFGPEGAAQAWIGGPGAVGKTNRKDSLGTSVGEYGKRFMGNLGQNTVQGSVGADPISAVNVPPTDAGMQAPGSQRVVQALLNKSPMGGAPQPMQPPQQVAQAQGAPEMAGNAMSDASGPDINQLMQAAANPWMSDGQKAVVSSLLEQKMRERQAMQERQQLTATPEYQLDLQTKQAQLDKLRNPQTEEPAEVRELRWRAEQAGLQPGTKAYQDFMTTGGKGPLVQVNNGDNSNKFNEESDKAAAGRMNDYVSAGSSAASFLGDIQQLASLGGQIGTGKEAQIMATLGPYAQALGIEVEGLGEMQAFNAIISRMAPQMRPAGSGASSDFDARQFLGSLPTMGNTPEGNQIINETFAAISQNKIQAAEIASLAFIPKEQGGLSWQEAEKQIRALPNPYERYRSFRGQTGKASPTAAGPRKSRSGVTWSVDP